MLQVIIGCVIANVLTIGIIGFSIYLVYRKNEKRLKEVGDELKDKIEGVKESVSNVVDIVEKIGDTLDKIPFVK